MTPDEISLRDFVMHIMDERDHRYSERDKAAKDMVQQALDAARSAADKTELALKEYKASANEWRATLNDMIARTVLRVDFDREQKHLQEQIAELRESRSTIQGKDEARNVAMAQSHTVRALIVSIISACTGWLITIILFLLKTNHR